jgi:hypothetical protein
VVRTKTGDYFVFPPAVPMIGRDGAAIKDRGGKSQYRPSVAWTKDGGRRKGVIRHAVADPRLATPERPNPPDR